jgi:hypothetical protein
MKSARAEALQGSPRAEITDEKNSRVNQPTPRQEECETESEVDNSQTERTRSQTDEKSPIYKYIGNSSSFKFHRPSCPFARAMWRGHIIKFHYRKQAIDAGQKPCRYCLPPFWKSVGAKILKDTPESQQGLSTVENIENLHEVNTPEKDVKSTAENDYTGN